MSFSVAQKTLERIEWTQLVDLWAAQCRTPQARDLLLAQRASASLFAASAGDAAERLAMTSEARSLLDLGEAPALGGINSDLETSFVRAEKGGQLVGNALRDVGASLTTLRETRESLVGRNDAAPLLADLGDAIGDHRGFEREIERCIDPTGDVRDAASPALRRARSETTRIASEVQTRLDRLRHSRDVRDALSDDFVTVRNDRYVLPVRADMRGRVRGIVHDASNTGTTLFIEPEAVIDLNNRLKQTELDAAREIDRILRELSKELALILPALRASISILVRVDLALAGGRLSKALNAHEPVVAADGIFELALLRHPLLPLDESVPNDIRLGEDYQILVISGPNAGGKTVSMKALALAALSVRAGLHVTAAPGARVALIDALLADIGDEQSIRESLSTFSAHMANLSNIVRNASPNALVALDEIGVGTDPGEGAALAQSVLESLADCGARVIATTHYTLLKEMASVDPRFCNASVQFDPETLAPTYRLTIGVPGSSSATAVAARMGMPSEVLDRANALLEREDRQLDRMISELASSRATLEREQREVELLRAESETTRDEYRAKLERVQERRDALFHSMREDLDRSFQDAHAQVAAVIRDLQRRGSAKDAAHARNRLQQLEARKREAATELGIGPKKPDTSTSLPSHEVDWQAIKPGDSVLVRGNVRATLETLPDRRGKVTVHAGSAKLLLDAEEVRIAADPDSGRSSGQRVTVDRVDANPPGHAEARGGWLECDLRGMRVAEALDRLDQVIDQASSESRDAVRIIHGIGTGALRSAVREHLAHTQLIKEFHSPEENGGEGVTEADLA